MQKIPIGNWIEELINYIIKNSENYFRLISDFINTIINYIIDRTEEISPTILILLLLIIFYLIKKNLKNTIIIGVGFFLILNLGYWRESIETVTLVLISTFFSTFFGIPIGIFCAHRPKAYSLLKPVLDLMQTVPTFVYLIPTLILFGLGIAPGIFSTIIFSMPSVIRLTYLGINKVPNSLLEVADSFGAGKWKKLWTIEIPCAKHSILTGISQCIMLSLSMSVIAALVGADGLGKPVIQALNTVNIVKGFESGLVIVIIAIILDRILYESNKKFGESV